MGGRRFADAQRNFEFPYTAATVDAEPPRARGQSAGAQALLARGRRESSAIDGHRAAAAGRPSRWNGATPSSKDSRTAPVQEGGPAMGRLISVNEMFSLNASFVSALLYLLLLLLLPLL